MASAPPKEDRRGAKPGEQGVQEHVWSERVAFTVIACVANGATQASIAWATRLDPKTLRKHYGEELANGRERAVSLIANRVFQDALVAGAVRSQELWLTRFGKISSVDKPVPEVAPPLLGANDDKPPPRLILEYVMPTMERPAGR